MSNVSDPIDILNEIDDDLIQIRAMAKAVQCMAEGIDHDSRLSGAFDGVGTTIIEIADRIDARCNVIDGIVREKVQS